MPPSHWGGGRSAPELLAAYVRPNDPTVDVILHDAATKLGDAGRETGLNGYTTGKKSRAWELAEAIWAALADRRIAYVLPPASFEQAGQKVRGPSDALERKVGTCLDLSLLYAACLAARQGAASELSAPTGRSKRAQPWRHADGGTRWACRHPSIQRLRG